MPTCIKNLLLLLFCLAFFPLAGNSQVKKTAPKKTNALETQAVDCDAALAANAITAPAITTSCFNSRPQGITGNILTPEVGYTYGWQQSTDNINFSDIPGYSYPSYNPDNIIGTRYYRRVATYTGCAVPSFSNSVKITVYPVLSNIYINKPAVTTFCGPVAKIGTIIGSDPQGGDGTYTYQWYNFNHNSSTPINGQTGRDITIDTITESKIYYRQVTSGGQVTAAGQTLGGCQDGGLVLFLTLKPYKAIDNNYISQVKVDTFFCAAMIYPVPMTGTVPTGVNGFFTYQWQQSTNGKDFTNIADPKSTEQNFTPPPITQTTWYRRMVIPDDTVACAGPQPSNVIKISLVVPPVDNIITKPAITSFCGPITTGVITGNKPAGNYTYQWIYSTDGNAYTDIPSQTGKDLEPQTVSKTTYFMRELKTSACTAPYLSNIVVKITIVPNTPIAGNTIKQLTPDIVFCPPSGDPSLITGSSPTGGTGDFAYQWQQATDNVNFTDITTAAGKQQNYDPPPITVTTYYRRVVSVPDNDCIAPDISDTIAVNMADTHITNNTIAQPVPDGKFCGSQATPKAMDGSLPGNGVYNYQWQSSTDNTTFTDIKGATGRNYNNPAEITTTTYYRRVVTSGFNCSPPVISNVITIQLNFVTNTLTTPAISRFCGPGDPGVITGTTGNTYSYQWQSSTDNLDYQNLDGDISANYDPPTLNETTYFRRVVTSTTCDAPSVSDVVMIAIITNPAGNKITAPATAIYCTDNGAANPDIITGNTPSVTGGAAFSYQWQSSADNINFTDITANAIAKDYTPTALNTTTYFRRVLTIAGCNTPTISNVVTITIYQPITNNVITAPAVISFCETGDASLVQGSTPGGGSGTYTYQWQSSADGQNFSPVADANVANMSYDPPTLNQTTWYRRVITSATCNTPLISNVVTITINTIANNNITAPSVINFCGSGDAEVITGSTGGTSSYTYQWQSSVDGTNFSDITTDATGVDYDPPVITATTWYRRKVTSVICGSFTFSNIIKVTVDAMPAVSADATICYGAGTVLTASGGTTYQWAPADGLSATDIASPTASPLINTTYTVTITNNSCTKTLTVNVNVIQKPTVNAGADKAVMIGDYTQLNGKVTGGDSVKYSWSPATYLDDPNSLTPISTPLKDITYTLTATSPNGCFIVTDQVTIKAYDKVIVPNTFTPNGDGINDTWEIAALSSYRNNVLNVYTRNGQLVYKSVGYPIPWDGTYNGKPLPFGTYYYIINLNQTIDLNNSPKTLSGYVTIVK